MFGMRRATDLERVAYHVNHGIASELFCPPWPEGIIDDFV
jgi:hypothetical protein